MKFSTVQIRPGGIDRDEWEVAFSDLPYDRVNEGHGPNSTGFYHYPRKLGKQAAFNTLKEHLVRKHEEEIAAMSKSLEKLRALEEPV